MISPVGRRVADLLRAQEQLPEPDGFGPADAEPPPDDPRYLMFKMKKRRTNALLKRMLVDAGYKDLAHMVSVTRDEADEHNDGEIPR